MTIVWLAILLILVFGVLGSIFWLWMLVDCVQHEQGNDRLVWVLIIVLLHWLGATLYFFIRRPSRASPARSE